VTVTFLTDLFPLV